eukprot:PhF_6_TR29115/c0_g1_i1/m.42485
MHYEASTAPQNFSPAYAMTPNQSFVVCVVVVVALMLMSSTEYASSAKCRGKQATLCIFTQWTTVGLSGRMKWQTCYSRTLVRSVFRWGALKSSHTSLPRYHPFLPLYGMGLFVRRRVKLWDRIGHGTIGSNWHS